MYVSSFFTFFCRTLRFFSGQKRAVPDGTIRYDRKRARYVGIGRDRPGNQPGLNMQFAIPLLDKNGPYRAVQNGNDNLVYQSPTPWNAPVMNSAKRCQGGELKELRREGEFEAEEG